MSLIEDKFIDLLFADDPYESNTYHSLYQYFKNIFVQYAYYYNNVAESKNYFIKVNEWYFHNMYKPVI